MRIRTIGIRIAPENRRLSCSIASCFVPTATKLSALQFGQSSQPSPESVRRTAAPVTMMIASSTRLHSVRRRNACGVSSGTRIGVSVRTVTRGGTQRVLRYPFRQCAAGSSFRSSRCWWSPVSPRRARCCGWNGLATTTTSIASDPASTTHGVGRLDDHDAAAVDDDHDDRPARQRSTGDVRVRGRHPLRGRRCANKLAADPSSVLAPIAPVLGAADLDGRQPRDRDHRRRHARRQGVHVPRTAVGAHRARGRRHRRREHGEQPRHGLRAGRARGLARPRRRAAASRSSGSATTRPRRTRRSGRSSRVSASR